MAQNRSDRLLESDDGLPLQMEMLRRSAESFEPQDSDNEERQIPLFWRIFGGTVLSITALVVMTAYQGLSGNIAELNREIEHLETDVHKEMTRLAEYHSDLIRKDECESRFRGVWTSLDEIRENRKGILEAKLGCDRLLAQHRDAVKERSTIQRDLQVVREHRAVAQQRAELRDELARLRERLASIESRRGTSTQPTMRPVSE